MPPAPAVSLNYLLDVPFFASFFNQKACMFRFKTNARQLVVAPRLFNVLGLDECIQRPNKGIGENSVVIAAFLGILS